MTRIDRAIVRIFEIIKAILIVALILHIGLWLMWGFISWVEWLSN